jgi:hypothetical protein
MRKLTMLVTDHQRDLVAFFFYFLRLRLSIILGQYYTANPVDIKWRWRHWQQIKALQHKHDGFFPIT